MSDGLLVRSVYGFAVISCRLMPVREALRAGLPREGFDTLSVEGYHHGMATTVKKLTYADYEKLPADGFRHEIVDGEEFMTPPPGTDHQTIVLNLASCLRAHVLREKLGRVFVAPTAVLLSKHDVVEPDVLFVSRANTGIITSKNIQGAPDLVIEVLSPSTSANDRGPKLALYGKTGVGEYWMIDPLAKTVEIHEFRSTRRTRSYDNDRSFQSKLLPGLTLRLEDIFATE